MQKNTKSLSELNWNDVKFFLEVSRVRKATLAAKRLGVDYTTVSRRVQALERSLNTLLFEKSKHAGFVLTEEGQTLLSHAEAIESMMLSAQEQVSGGTTELSGRIRIGCTEGFGNFFLAPKLSEFQARYPMIGIDILAVPHFVSLSKREADLAITLERPTSGPYVSSRLCDYRLKLYATQDYLNAHGPIRCVNDLHQHAFITYVEDLVFSDQLHYLQHYLSSPSSPLCFTGVLGQYYSALAGHHLAILPCFIAGKDPRLIEVLPQEVVVTNSFWISCRQELRQLKRIRVLWDYLRELTEQQQALLMGRA